MFRIRIHYLLKNHGTQILGKEKRMECGERLSMYVTITDKVVLAVQAPAEQIEKINKAFETAYPPPWDDYTSQRISMLKKLLTTRNVPFFDIALPKLSPSHKKQLLDSAEKVTDGFLLALAAQAVKYLPLK